MTTASHPSHSDTIEQLPLARLYAEEESFIFPLREYLASHGCNIVVNDQSIISETYFIVAGSPAFVKSIFAQTNSQALRTLGIVITSSPSDAQMLVDDSRKIVVIDPRYLTHSDVDEIFTFFFSGSELLLNITRNIHEPSMLHEAASYDAPLDTVKSEHLPQQKTYENSSTPVETKQQFEDVLSSQDTERIRHIMSDVFGDTQSKRKKRNTHMRDKRFFHIFSSAMIAVLFFIGVLLFPLSSYLASLSASSFFLMRSASFIGKTDIAHAQSSLTSGQYWLGQSTFMLSLLKIPLDIVGWGTSVRGQERLVSFLSDVSLGIEESIAVVTHGKTFIQTNIPSAVRSNEKLPASSIETLRISVVAAHTSLGLAEAELALLLRDKTFPFSLSYMNAVFLEARKKLQSVRTVLSYAEELLTVYPKIAGFRTAQSFLILLQNSNELRPTGGFIGSVGLATFENGSLSDFSIEDVYALDGQLKGHVDPPSPIAELLGNEHWYLRDSNWDPDFSISGAKALWFYEKESGKNIDGVIAINVPIFVTILKAIGPIQLPDYSDRITHENFFGKSLYYTQNNFFPGSTQKRDFLGALARASMTKIMTDRDIDGMSLMDALMNGVENRDIMFYFRNPEVQSMIEHFGWSGRVYMNTLCRGVDSDRCVADEVLLAEANLSVSKVNYYVTHNARREITLTPQGEIHERVSYIIGNTVNTTTNPNERGVGGTYQTYLRFILPTDSIVNAVMLDGVAVPTRGAAARKVIPELPYIENTEGTQSSRGIGIALRVNPGERKEIQITYIRAQPLQFGKGGAYLDLLWYKHPGISSMPLQTIIRYPLYWSASNIPGPTDESLGTFIAKEGEFEYNTQIERDTNYRIKFIQ